MRTPRKRTATGPRLFVGLDLSLTGTGLVALEPGGGVRANFTIEPPAGCKGAARLVHIRQIVETWTVDQKQAGYNVAVQIEDHAFAAKFQAAPVGELHGVIKVMLFEADMRFELCAPQRLKKFICEDPARSKKEHVIMEVYRRWGFSAADNNQADAYGLAAMAALRAGMPWWRVTKRQEECVPGEARRSDV